MLFEKRKPAPMLRRWFKRIDLILRLRCEQHTRLRSDQLDRRLDLTERLAVMGHWIVCGSCRNVTSRLRAIDRASHDLAKAAKASLPEDARRRIARHLVSLPSDELPRHVKRSESGPE